MKKFTTLDLILVSLNAAIGIALKPVIGPIIQAIGASFFFPTGAIAGAIYMIWPLLALLIINKLGSATLVGIVQALIVFVTGIYGSHGIFTFFTYILPCLVIDLIYFLLNCNKNKFWLFVPPAMGNATGTFLVGSLMMHLPVVPLLLGTIPAFVFGGIAGWLAYSVNTMLSRVSSTKLQKGERL